MWLYENWIIYSSNGKKITEEDDLAIQEDISGNFVTRKKSGGYYLDSFVVSKSRYLEVVLLATRD